MKLYIVCSDKYIFNIHKKRKPFTTIFNDVFAERFIKHLQDDSTLCTGCGKNCVNCRKAYNLNFSSNIIGIFKVSPELLYYIDEPNQYLPREIPEHDVMIAINIYEDILATLPEMAVKAGAKALIVPVEHPNWISNWGKLRVKKECIRLKLESAFPKPFCSLTKENETSFVNKFIDYFRIGRPELKVEIENGLIKGVQVLRSAPCGNTYFVAHNIIGKKADETLENYVAKYWHSYPCIASMEMDFSLGDTILHKGGYIHLEAIREATEENILKKS
ncbi:MAG: DUF166 family protein [Candidatus Subteraquimicrobiales bacterium]|nr:DUF166 family protein [Candidatus Subteraquimicrobiales bacterium]